MAIDINKPVKQGADLVLNHADGAQSLGTVEDRDKAEGLNGLHTNPTVEETVEVVEEPKKKK